MQLHSHHFVKYYFFEKHNEYLYLAMEKCLLNLKDFAKFESNPSLPE
jgi:serine/threonine-protein kinase/endoribonuclease IRE1